MATAIYIVKRRSNLLPWSLTEVHEKLGERYGLTIPPTQAQVNGGPVHQRK
jgi:hypothetical protein